MVEQTYLLLVVHAAYLQVLKLAGLLGVLLGIMEVVAEVEGSDSFLYINHLGCVSL